jgi:hypothetical protein
MTKLLDADVTYIHQGEPRLLRFSHGQIAREETASTEKPKSPWQDLDVETFDRMSVLLSELEKYDHSISWRN